MFEAYQFDAQGYYVGPIAMPNNTTDKAPTVKEGCIPKWTGEKWVQEENHKGKSGFLNGLPHTITEYGPLPEGWSDTPPEPTAEEKAEAIRAERDALLAATDYLMIRDYPISAETLEAVEAYRQALRDLPSQTGFPDDIVWPVKPDTM